MSLNTATRTLCADIIMVPIAKGGTNASNAPQARTNLGIGPFGTVSAPIPILSGGTGATTAAQARINLGLGTLATLSSVGTNQINLSSVTHNRLAFDGGAFSFRNKIINGDMRIDQYNAGSAITLTNSVPGYPVDRFFVFSRNNNSQTTACSRQSTGTEGNTEQSYYMRTNVTVGANYQNTPGGLEQFNIQQRIEGFNVVGFRYGTPSAKTITISFWVRSNYTGNYSFVLTSRDAAVTPFPSQCRFYATGYTINQANVWEKKTIVVPGDTNESTASRWFFDNNIGLIAIWNLGLSDDAFQSGGTLENVWNTQDRKYDISIQQGLQTLHNKTGAYFDLTGVQIEEGSVATPFEYRPIQTELDLCQRYYEYGRNYDARWGNAIFISGGSYYATNEINVNYKVNKRAVPTITFPYRAISSGANVSTIFMGPSTFVSGYGTVIGGTAATTENFFVSWAPIYTGTDAAPFFDWRASAEL
jgi:hypothetical protein